MSGDTWLIEYDAVAQRGQNIMENISERNRESKGSSLYLKQSSKIRASLKHYESDLVQLREKLVQSSTRKRITEREAERRQNMLDQLVSKQKQLEQALKNDNSSHYANRMDLLGNPIEDNNTLWTGNYSYMGDDDGDMEPLLDVNNYRQRQQQIIRDQDEGLDVLSSAISRQRQMAVDIGNEVDYQNDIIEDIHTQVNSTDSRIVNETKHIRIVDRKSNTCWYWLVAILLFVAILVVIFVPFHGKI